MRTRRRMTTVGELSWHFRHSWHKGFQGTPNSQFSIFLTPNEFHSPSPYPLQLQLQLPPISSSNSYPVQRGSVVERNQMQFAPGLGDLSDDVKRECSWRNCANANVAMPTSTLVVSFHRPRITRRCAASLCVTYYYLTTFDFA